MIKKVIRIDGNPEYEYAKAYIVLAGDKIYHNTSLKDDVTVEVLVEVDKSYINYLKGTDTLEEVIALLDLIRPRLAGFDYDENWNKLCNVNNKIKKAMQVCEITGEDQTDVGGIKGLTITNW